MFHSIQKIARIRMTIIEVDNLRWNETIARWQYFQEYCAFYILSEWGIGIQSDDTYQKMDNN